jgi:aldehyde:ferredoxin oxidoreductase
MITRELGRGAPLGRILGNGTDFTARAFGVVRNPTVKGLSMPAYDPRAVKRHRHHLRHHHGWAPSHTAGYTIAPEILGVSGKQDPLSPQAKPT